MTASNELMDRLVALTLSTGEATERNRLQMPAMNEAIFAIGLLSRALEYVGEIDGRAFVAALRAHPENEVAIGIAAGVEHALSIAALHSGEISAARH